MTDLQHAYIYFTRTQDKKRGHTYTTLMIMFFLNT